MPSKALVLDANILVRAVLGKPVRDLMEAYSGRAAFFVPEAAYAEAEEHLSALVAKRGGDPQKALVFLHALSGLVKLIGRETYGEFEVVARERLGQRDPDDWPVVAVALLLDLPIWTEDQDLFGSGLPTWTTDRVEVYLKSTH